MTQGIVSIRKNGQMVYKIITGHDGMHAPEVARAIKERNLVPKDLPTIEDLQDLCDHFGFGCRGCLIILEADANNFSRPIAHVGPDCLLEGEDRERYFDTFRVAQFNPRWKYGTADYVEVVDL